MKQVFAGLVLALMAIVGQAQSTSDTKDLFFYRVEHIDLAATDALRITRRAMADRDHTAARQETVALVKAGKGIRTATTGAAGLESRAVALECEACFQVIYGTEFDPPELANEVSGTIFGEAVPRTNATPTACEVEPVGTTLRVASDQDSKDGTIGIQSKLTDLTGMRQFGDGASRECLPDFHRRSLNSVAIPPEGKWMLLGMVAPPAADGEARRTLVWARADRMKAGPPPSGDDWKRKSVTLITEAYELGPADCGDLLEAWDGDHDTTKLRGEIVKLAGQGKAKLVGALSQSLRLGSPSLAEAGPEWIYPTEYDPPELPNVISGPALWLNHLVTPATPTAFESQSLGWRSAVELQVPGEPECLQANIDLSWNEHDLEETCGFGVSRCTFPIFRHLQWKILTRLEFSRPHLLGVASPPVRAWPAPEIKKCEEWDKPPVFQTSATPRVVVFLTPILDTK